MEVVNNLLLLRRIGRILLKHIEANRKYGDLSITYGNVAMQLSADFNPKNLSIPLGELSDLCRELGLPLISTIVVKQDTMLPGDGYYHYYFPGSYESEWEAIFEEQHRLVLECEDWSPLAKELGIK